eukprot:s3371_g12.t1
MPANLDESLEETIEVSDVRAAQTIVGELLWASCRTRPDLAYGVSWLGRMVTKAPRRVRQYGEHMVGYVKSALEMSLSYGKCPGPTEDENLAFPRLMQRLEVHSDASFAPAGGRDIRVSSPCTAGFQCNGNQNNNPLEPYRRLNPSSLDTPMASPLVKALQLWWSYWSLVV